MKSFYDLTTPEKIALTGEQIEYYAKLECANRGIIIPLKPVSSPLVIDAPKTDFYSVSYEGRYWLSQDDAKLYADLIARSYNSATQAGYTYATRRNNGTQEIKISQMFTDSEYEGMREKLIENDNINREWKDYNNGVKEYLDVVKEIVNEVSDLVYYDGRENHYDRVFNEYVELAENDAKVGYSFFEKAYKNAQLPEVDREVVDKILEKAKPKED